MTEAYPEPCQTIIMEYFAKIGYTWKISCLGFSQKCLDNLLTHVKLDSNFNANQCVDVDFKYLCFICVLVGLICVLLEQLFI